MKQFGMLVIAASLLVSAPALASLDLAKKSNCMSCHMVDKKILGPAFQSVAEQYAGNPEAQKLLVEKVKRGGKGHWGEIPMPPNSHVKDADLETLIRWILSGAKS